MCLCFDVSDGSELIMVDFLLVLELFFKKLLIISSVADGERALSAFFDEDIHEGLERRVDDQVDELALVELQREFVVEREVDDFLVVDAQGNNLEGLVLIVKLYLIELVAGQSHDRRGIGGLLTELSFLGSHLHPCFFILRVGKR